MRFSVPPHFQSIKAIQNCGASMRRGNSVLLRVTHSRVFSRSISLGFCVMITGEAGGCIQPAWPSDLPMAEIKLIAMSHNGSLHNIPLPSRSS
jgi:hypothetical protein